MGTSLAAIRLCDSLNYRGHCEILRFNGECVILYFLRSFAIFENIKKSFKSIKKEKNNKNNYSKANPVFRH